MKIVLSDRDNKNKQSLDEIDKSMINKLTEIVLTDHYGDIGNLPEDLFRQVLSSWNKIFDFEWHNRYFGAENIQKRCIQGTFWQLTIDDVRKVTTFIAR